MRLFLCVYIVFIGYSMISGFTVCNYSRRLGVNVRVRNAFRASLSTVTSQPSISESSKRKNFFISTPIYYVNGQPHLGHAYTSTISDILARYQRKDDANVYFLTGTDEHGQKVEQSAIRAGTTPLEYSTHVSTQFQDMTALLGCSNDDFIRTTEVRHKDAVNELWKKLEANGQIYLGHYEGWYSVRDEAFYSETELVNGKAPTGADVEWVKEPSYFFRLSEWTDKLLQLHTENPEFLAPKSRRAEVLAFLQKEGGLHDLSISRTTFSWGIPVPNDPAHVMYVWLDALVNYITALGYPDTQCEKFTQFWPAAVHIVGKDIVRFHALFWPAFLMAAGLPIPQRIFAHGWWTRDGEKMSKSVGNVLDPVELVRLYGVDYVRYFLASEFHFGNDGDFSHEAFCHRINLNLANDLGNLAQRVLTMIHRNCAGVIPQPGELTEDDRELLRAVRENVAEVRSHLDVQAVKSVCDAVMHTARLGNRYFDTQAPWLLVKSDPARLQTVLYVLSELLRHAAILLQPVMPKSCDGMLDQLGVPSDPTCRNFAALSDKIIPGTKILMPRPVFPKVEIPVVPVKGAVASAAPLSPELAAKLAAYDSLSADEIVAKIADVGSLIRAKKLLKVTKEDLKPFLQELTHLKNRDTELKSSKQ